jgi:glycerol-3-phosphate acyltransferase PlsY
VIFNEPEHLYRVFAIVVAMLVLVTHQKNIGRLIKGSESKAPILKHRDRRRTGTNSPGATLTLIFFTWSA